MGGFVRLLAWVWLLLGFGALSSGFLQRHGLYVPGLEKLGGTLSLPWNLAAPVLETFGAGATATMAFGVGVNVLILLVIANILER
jgi:hypothetical protein